MNKNVKKPKNKSQGGKNMLIQFSVENYKSIRDELIINFSTEKKNENGKWVIPDKKIASVYNCIGLIGPNASGKTNIIDALYFALKFIDRTISRKENSSISVDTFGFSEEYKNTPSSFEFIFVHNEVKYVYGFSITEKEVIEEYLMGYFTAKAKTIFERSEGQKFNFKGNDVKQQSEISKKTNANRLYMPVAAEWGYEPAKKVRDWFDLMSRQYENFDIPMLIEKIFMEESKKKYFLEELQKADFNIVDIYVEKERLGGSIFRHYIRYAESGQNIEKEQLEEINYRNKVIIVHENSKGELFKIDLNNDSDGTYDIVSNLTEIMTLGQAGGLMLEDELGSNYHTKLTKYFLNALASPKINPGNAQLFFASHDTKILNLLNPDQIYLVDKDDDGATFVTLLSDYQIRQGMDVELGYLKGRFGGIPYMRG